MNNYVIPINLINPFFVNFQGCTIMSNLLLQNILKQVIKEKIKNEIQYVNSNLFLIQTSKPNKISAFTNLYISLPFYIPHKDCLISVSYTHLDVYKRQVTPLLLLLRPGFTAMTSCESELSESDYNC